MFKKLLCGLLVLGGCTTNPTTGAKSFSTEQFIVAMQHQCGLIVPYDIAAKTVDALANGSKASGTIDTVASLASVSCAVFAANIPPGTVALPTKDTVAPIALGG